MAWNHDRGDCPVCSGMFDDAGVLGWQELTAAAMSALYAAIEYWRLTPANSMLVGMHLENLTRLHNALAEHAAALDPLRFALQTDEEWDGEDCGEGGEDE